MTARPADLLLPGPSSFARKEARTARDRDGRVCGALARRRESLLGEVGGVGERNRELMMRTTPRGPQSLGGASQSPAPAVSAPPIPLQPSPRATKLGPRGGYI